MVQKRHHYSIFNQKEFEDLKHPKEDGYFVLALITASIVTVLVFIFTIQTFGGLLLLIGLGVLISWIVMEINHIRFVGNAIRVSPKSFPKVYTIYKALHTEMQMKKEVPIYIVQDGEVNGFISKFFRRRFILFNSELVAGMDNEKFEMAEIEWVIARFLGAIKAKHFRFTLFFYLIDEAEWAYIFNFLLYPYERTIQLTGDNIGLLANKNLEASLSALNRLMIGNDLSQDLRIEGVLHQAKRLQKHAFFAFIAKLYSPYPYGIRRYLNLLGFAKKEFPDQYRNYVAKLDPEYRRALDGLIVVYA